MFADKSKVPSTNSLSGLLLTLTALSGEFPVTLIDRLPGSKAYREKVVNACKREHFLRTFERNGLKSLRLTPAAKQLLLSNRPDWFQPYLTGRAEPNCLKGEITRRLRLCQMTEVMLNMLNADILAFPWEKPAIFQSAPIEALIDSPAYYNSREVKEIGPQSQKIRGSRATGVLITDGGVFSVYNTGASAVRWRYSAEMRLKSFLQSDVCRIRLPEQYFDILPCSIVFGADMSCLADNEASTWQEFELPLKCP